VIVFHDIVLVTSYLKCWLNGEHYQTGMNEELRADTVKVWKLSLNHLKIFIEDLIQIAITATGILEYLLCTSHYAKCFLVRLPSLHNDFLR
jgi:hypothetical protein